MVKPGRSEIIYACENMFPPHLVHHIRGTQPRRMALRDCNNNVWYLDIEKHGDNWYFTKGWRTFARDYKIKRGDLIYYEYVSKGLLQVEISTLSRGRGGEEIYKVRKIKEVKPEDVVAEEAAVEAEHEEEASVEAEHEEEAADESGFADDESEDLEAFADDEAEYVESCADNEAEYIVASADDEASANNGAGTSVPVQRKKRGKNIDIYGSDLFTSGRIRRPDHTFFVTEMRDRRLNELYLPKDIVYARGIQLPDHTMIVDSHGRKFPTRLRRWTDGRTVYIGGWKGVCIANSAKKGDKIICEFVPSDTGALKLNVTFLPQDRRER